MIEKPQGRPPFRADHVGSLLRPQVLRQAFRDHHAKRLDDAAFAKIQDECIRDVVKMQEEVGLEVVTDGEFRRMSYWGRFVERCAGFTIKPAVFKFRDDHGHEVDFTATYAAAKLQRTQALAVDEFAFTKTVVTRAMPKITLPAPSTMHFYRCTDYADPTVYRDLQTFMEDLTGIFRQEIAALAAEGCRYIQLDEVAVAMLRGEEPAADEEARLRFTRHNERAERQRRTRSSRQRGDRRPRQAVPSSHRVWGALVKPELSTHEKLRTGFGEAHRRQERLYATERQPPCWRQP